MKYTPKHTDNVMRAIYAGLIVFAFAFMNIGTGLLHTIFMCIAVVFLCAGLFLFTRFEMTTFSYLIRDVEDELYFYVDKATGKRGAYICFLPLKDCVAIEKMEKGKKKAIQEQHGKAFFYNYNHNRLAKDKYIVVFQNEDHFDGIICQLDQPSLELLHRGVSIAKKPKSEGNIPSENSENI